MTNIYERDLDRNPANYAPLTPLSFLERAAYVYPRRTAVVHGEVRITWGEVYARCRRLASALRQAGVGIGDTNLNGSLDLQVPASLNLPILREALAEAGNDRSLVAELPGLNHLFQHALTGAPSEYGAISETMAPEVLTQIADWIARLP